MFFFFFFFLSVFNFYLLKVFVLMTSYSTDTWTIDALKDLISCHVLGLFGTCMGVGLKILIVPPVIYADKYLVFVFLFVC